MTGIHWRLRKEVTGFSLDVEFRMGNELIVLFGHSGSGKSMTLQLLAGLLRPDNGFVRSAERMLFDSSEGVDLPPQKRSLGYVFQDLALFPHLKVRENILFGVRGLRRHAREGVLAEMIETFRLGGLEERLPSEISGGQKQRVAFARALSCRPSVLLLDEPFSALDMPIRLEMRQVLREIRDLFRIPIILVTHDIDEAAETADRMIVYSNGRAVQAGTPEEVLRSPLNGDVATLVRPRARSGGGMSLVRALVAQPSS